MIRLHIPWDYLASSNQRNQRRGGKAHGWGYKRSREAIYLWSLNFIRGERPRYEGPVHMTLKFYPPDRRRRDVSNFLKVIFDGLEGAAYKDDYQIESHYVERMGADSETPRVEVEISPMEGEE